MSRNLTSSDRASLIRLASTLPAGSAERKAILAGLRKTSGEGASSEVGPKLSADVAKYDMADELAKWGADVVAVYLKLPVDMKIGRLARKIRTVQKDLGTISPAQAYERNDNLLLKAIRSAGLDLSRLQ